MPLWLAPVLIAQTSGAFLLALVFYYFYHQRRERCAGLWACGLCTYALWLILHLLTHMAKAHTLVLTVASVVAFAASGFFILAATVDFCGARLARRWMLLYGALVAGLCGWIVYAIDRGLLLHIVTAPAFFPYGRGVCGHGPDHCFGRAWCAAWASILQAWRCCSGPPEAWGFPFSCTCRCCGSGTTCWPACCR